MRELKVRMTSLEETIKVQFEAQRSQSEAQFKALEGKSDAQFKAIMAAISQGKADSELSNYKQIAALSERVAALEAQRQ